MTTLNGSGHRKIPNLKLVKHYPRYSIA